MAKNKKQKDIFEEPKICANCGNKIETAVKEVYCSKECSLYLPF